MHKLLNSHHPVRHAKSFKYAFSGIFHVLMNEANFRLQIAVIVFFSTMAFYFRISTIEWAILILSMGFLLSAEVLNTVMEELMDHFFKEYNETARIVKDLSAGYVLVASFTCLSVFILTVGVKAL